MNSMDLYELVLQNLIEVKIIRINKKKLNEAINSNKFHPGKEKKLK